MTTSSLKKRTNLIVGGVGVGIFVGGGIIAVTTFINAVPPLMRGLSEKSLSDQVFGVIGSLLIALFFAVLYAVMGAIAGAMVGGIIGTVYHLRRHPLPWIGIVGVGLIMGVMILVLYYLTLGGAGLQELGEMFQRDVLLLTLTLAGCIFISYRLNRELQKNLAIHQQGGGG